MSPANSNAPAPEIKTEKLSFATKLAYGAGDLGPAITANILVFFLLPFFTDVAGIKPGIAGAILFISKIWDAINDPIVGVLTDKTKTRWGRRRPWILFGAVPFGLCFIAQWWVPFPGNEWALIAYYLLIAVLFNTFYTAVNLPYTALTPELTQDYDERTDLNKYRFAFSIGGSLISAILFLPMVNLLGQGGKAPMTGYLLAGTVWAIASTLPLFWCFWGTKERYQQDQEEMPLLTQLKIAFSNRPYLYVIGIYICSWLAVQATATIIPYYITYWMQPKDGTGASIPVQVISFAILAVQGTSFVMLFVWSKVSVKIGKRAVYALGMSVWILAQAGLYFLKPDQLAFMYVLAVMAGIGVSTAYIVPWSMMPDVIELDELNTGQRREGVFYGFMVLLQKVGLAIALFLVGIALDGSGFIKPLDNQPVLNQPEAVLQSLRVMIGPVPTVFLILGMILAALYPITKQKHAEILALLAAKKSQQASGS